MITEEIDVLKLYAGTIQGLKNNKEWNDFLQRCVRNGDINTLMSVRRGLQMGMNTAVKNKMSSEGLANMFCRWTGSIDKTMRRIVKSKDALQNDGIKTALKHDERALKDKRTRDVALEEYIKKGSF